MSTVRVSTSVYLLPGMKAKLFAKDFFSGVGDEAIPTLDGSSTVTRTLTNGWAVVDEATGSIEPIENEAAVIYTQKKFGHNKIYFYSRSREVAYVDVISVPIHDHSSIVAGGPAYGTYFTDDDAI